MVDNEWYCIGPVTPQNFNKFPQNMFVSKWAIRFGLKVKYSDNAESNKYYDMRSDMLMTKTWSAAPIQFEYFSNPNNGYINGDVIHVTTQEELKKVSDVQVGDLIYWDWYRDSDGIVNYATIVSRIDADGTIYYAGNTGTHLEQRASDILEQGEMYIVKLNDCIFE